MAAVLLALSGLVFANHDIAFTANTPANATWRSGLDGADRIVLNVSSNQTISGNASTFMQWYNTTNSSTNISGAGRTTNGTLWNISWWYINLSSFGVYRFDVTIQDNVSGHGTTIQRYIYYDNSTPNLTINDPDNGETFLDTVVNGNANVSFAFNGGDSTNLDTCFYNTDNGSSTTLPACGNFSVLLTYATHTINISVNDSNGFINSSYSTFYVNFSGSAGGGGGGAVPPSAEPPLVSQEPVPSQTGGGSGYHFTGLQLDFGGWVANIRQGIVNFVNSILGLFGRGI